MSFPNLPELLTQIVDHAVQAVLIDLEAQVNAWLAAEHVDSGAHGDVTAKQIVLTPTTAEGLTKALQISRADIAGGQGIWIGVTTNGTDPIGALMNNAGTVVLQWGTGKVSVLTALSSGAITLGGSDGISVTGTGNISMAGGSITVTPAFPGTSTTIAPGSITTGPITVTSIGGPMWNKPVFAASNFTGAGGTWTVPGGAQVTYECFQIGKQLTVLFEIEGTAVSGGVTELNIAIPNSLTATNRTRVLIQVVDNGAAAAVGVARVEAAGTIIRCQSTIAGGAWTNTGGLNTTSVRGQITFEVN